MLAQYLSVRLRESLARLQIFCILYMSIFGMLSCIMPMCLSMSCGFFIVSLRRLPPAAQDACQVIFTSLCPLGCGGCSPLSAALAMLKSCFILLSSTSQYSA